MIAAGMVYTILVSALLVAAAWALERALRIVRRPVRFMWLAAMALVVGIATWRFVAPGRQARSAQGDYAAVWSPPGAFARNAPPGPHAYTPTRPAEPRWPARLMDAWSSARTVSVPAAAASLDAPLAVLWLAGSLAWATILIASATRIRRQRSTWRPIMLDGAPVYASHDIGPALFGIVRHSIVVPSWVAEMDESRRQLIISHEREHARAGDPILLLAGAVAVLLQPWNPCVWLAFRRLRFTIETDCDARVLARSPDRRSYGDLLLDVGERALGGVTPIAALSEPYSLLGWRIDAMTRRETPHPVRWTVVSSAAAAVLLVAACRTPRPVLSPAEPPDSSYRVADEARAEPPMVRGERSIMHVTSVGLETDASTPTLIIYPRGRPSIGLGADAPKPLTDTLRLHYLPAMTLDLTDGDINLRLLSRGRISIDGDLTGGRARHLSANGRHIVVLQGGLGVRMDAPPDDSEAAAVWRWRDDATCIPSDSLRRELTVAYLAALARKLHPEVFEPAFADSSITVALVFDADCVLQSHAIGRRRAGRLSVDEAFREVMPGIRVRAVRGGFVSLHGGVRRGSPWVVWAEEPPDSAGVR